MAFIILIIIISCLLQFFKFLKIFSDVEYHLVTYGGDVKTYPAHITIGGKLTFKGKAPALQFSDSADTEPYQLDCSKLNKNKFSEYIRQYLRTDESLCPKLNRGLEYIQELLHDFNLAIGNNVQARTYADAIKYPFRAESVKTIIAVTGEQCEVGDFYGVSTENNWSNKINESVRQTMHRVIYNPFGAVFFNFLLWFLPFEILKSQNGQKISFYF